MVGSYEDKLKRLSEAISSEFGDSAVLISTFDDRVALLNEDGIVSSSYRITDGVVSFFDMGSHSLDSEQDIVRDGMDSFFEGKSISSALEDLVSNSVANHLSPYTKTKRELDRIAGEGMVWRKSVTENRKSILRDIAGEPFMSSGLTRRFGDRISESEKSEAINGAVGLESKLAELLVSSRGSLSDYRNEVSGRDADTKEAMMHFESFATDYVMHLESILGIMSRAIHRGCADCAALVHDGVADMFEDIEIGNRMIKRISNEFRRTK